MTDIETGTGEVVERAGVLVYRECRIAAARGLYCVVATEFVVAILHASFRLYCRL